MKNFSKKIITILERLIEKLRSCTDNKQVIKFQDLTPIDDADLTGYEEALDHVFNINNNKIKNIAITGSYGSGKSSILYTYEKDNPELKFIYISFLHFKECDKKDINNYENKEEDKISENSTKTEINLERGKENVNEIDRNKIREIILERKIINHIINQIPFKYISDTNFNVRGNIGVIRAFFKAIFNLLSLGSARFSFLYYCIFNWNNYSW